ncbi:unnamed protein product [Orchesella dallaii]|uniref:Uncharacterized protein n=1 Tax=Orchesella dallaii TaxID=48710 RepID=A0ABP1Q9Q4_9HEXA
MKFIWTSSLTLIAFCIVFLADLVRSDHKKVECAGHDISLSQQEIDAMKKCFDKIGITSLEDMKEDHLPCLAKCIMEDEGLLDEQGKPHKESIMRDIDTAVPEKMREKYKAAMEKCIDDHANDFSPDDELCTSYRPFIMCVLQAVNNICYVAD